MNKKYLLAVGLTLLFLGVGIQPAIADVSNISVSDREEDCNLCPPVSEHQMDKLYNLKDRLAINIKDILDLNWNFPVLCLLLYSLFYISLPMFMLFGMPFAVYFYFMGGRFNCSWVT